MISITANGKEYLVAAPRAYSTLDNVIGVAYTYFSTRNGERFGPIRTASTITKGKGVGAQLVAAAQEAYNADHDAMIAEATRLTEEFHASGRDGAWPTIKLITR